MTKVFHEITFDTSDMSFMVFRNVIDNEENRGEAIHYQNFSSRNYGIYETEEDLQRAIGELESDSFHYRGNDKP